ncbi:MAG TPA: SDR family NAD(P)-dependent oxidoreductase [Dermatophilaceae bacterium]|nr:SDR family NAD(P)-dependent oxidoreductase [Dermatophilaceae bacterium]
MQITSSTVAVVTGGASGLGEASVRRFVADGGAAVIMDLENSKGAEMAAELGDRVKFAPTDVRDEAQVQAAIDMAKELGEVRINVNCAGIGDPGRLLGKKGPLPLDHFRRVIEINLIGTFNVMRLAAAAMAQNEPVDGDRGVIINTASVAAYDGQVGQVSYAASKGGVVAMTLSVARDLADKAIRVMTIVPGTFHTPMMATLPQQVLDSLGAAVPHPSRLGEPDEYSSLAAEIVRNGMLNGECIRIDGAIRMPPR